MKVRALLDSDLTTIGRMLRAGVDWWLRELAAMLPAALSGTGRAFDRLAIYDGATIVKTRSGIADPALSGALPVAIAPSHCLVRTMTMPPMSAGDLRHMAAIDADRLMPLPAGQLLLATAIDGRDAGGEHIMVRIAGLPVGFAEQALRAAAAAGVQPTRFGVLDDDRRMRLDFLPAMRERAMVAMPSRAAAPWWTIVAFLFLLNAALLVWRDVQDVERLEGIVAAQAPAVAISRSIAGRIERIGAGARAVAARRAEPDAMEVLAEVTRVLPPSAWVQRYAWDGATVRVTGYRQGGTDVLGALRRSPRFADVRGLNEEVVAALPTGEPFDVAAKIVRKGRR